MSSEIEKWIGFVPPIDSKDLIPTKASLVTTAAPKPKQNAIPLNTAMEASGFITSKERGISHVVMPKPQGESEIVTDTCSGEEFTSEREAAITRSIDYDKLAIYLNSDANPTCLRYKAA